MPALHHHQLSLTCQTLRDFLDERYIQLIRIPDYWHGADVCLPCFKVGSDMNVDPGVIANDLAEIITNKVVSNDARYRRYRMFEKVWASGPYVNFRLRKIRTEEDKFRTNIVAYTDATVKDENGKVNATTSVCITNGNNLIKCSEKVAGIAIDAEFKAVIMALKVISTIVTSSEEKIDEITVNTDNLVVINQVYGAHIVNGDDRIRYCTEIRGMLDNLKSYCKKVALKWIPREGNIAHLW
jgi:ribonuclease HI